ncbi:RagB/SusD family nutrient uptake outer membrane protein [Pedobacter sandarakinus]|uniref:RagB/SusD family nutrient uptake outer membrane protein n=1 Tax=Pedobacter sandarakinus TaxID=353156 RepID=UPI00224870B5|nr:RagB/SusD family nutrient uptake outer membrane protein [Pedobacter sandarakinus]MCX2574090.1 RagB/SusD family nutrient uptake outer membrane protein [Pedobacter sandarakinus]
MKSKIIISLSVCLLVLTGGCKKILEVTPEAEFAPANVLTSEAGVKALLFSAYQNYQEQPNMRDVINLAEVTTDMAFNSGGNENLYLTQFINFAWDPSISQFQGVNWGPSYRIIRDANLVLESIATVESTDAFKKQIGAEARFLRALAYVTLYNWYGPVPLRISSKQEPELARASDDEMKTFIESELNAVVDGLPDPGKEEAFGRATKGAALGLLTKFMLNTKQWQKASDAAKRVMDLNYYQLFPVFKDLFKVENEGNKEMIFVMPCINQTDQGNWMSAGAMPTAFLSTTQLPEYRWNAGIQNFATMYRLRDELVNTFAANDARFVTVLRTYTNTSNATINLRATVDNARSLKFFDNAAVKNDHGNDFPIIRYADILLSRAEALNEASGPSVEALSYLNPVRVRAGIPVLTLADVPSQDAFRDAILRERGWEFITEGKRREDLIRQGKFISKARARGVNARDEQVLFPIPQAEIDANKLIVQNKGY